MTKAAVTAMVEENFIVDLRKCVRGVVEGVRRVDVLNEDKKGVYSLWKSTCGGLWLLYFLNIERLKVFAQVPISLTVVPRMSEEYRVGSTTSLSTYGPCSVRSAESR